MNPQILCKQIGFTTNSVVVAMGAHLNECALSSISHGHNSPEIDSVESLQIVVARRNSHSSGLHRLRQEAMDYPEWFDEMDLVDSDCCTRSEINTLIVSAPTEFTRGMFYGKLTLRIHHSTLSGRDFTCPGGVSPEAKETLQRIGSRLLALSEVFIEWFAQLEQIDPDFCSRAELDELIITSPVSFIEGFLFGKLTTRIQMSTMTGCAFT